MPKDRITQLHQGYGFIEFLGEEDADYAIKVMNMIKVYGKPIRVNKVHEKFYRCVCICTVHVQYTCTCICTGYIGIIRWLNACHLSKYTQLQSMDCRW